MPVSNKTVNTELQALKVRFEDLRKSRQDAAILVHSFSDCGDGYHYITKANQPVATLTPFVKGRGKK